jgi:hypothetical protein
MYKPLVTGACFGSGCSIEPERARATVKPWLAPGGRLAVVYDAPGR